MIEASFNDSATSEDGASKSCTGSSILRASLKSSKIKIDEFFRGKTYDFRKKNKRIKKEDNQNCLPNNNNDIDNDDESKKGVRLLGTTSLDEVNKKRKVPKVSELLSPILSFKKIGDAFHKSLTDKKIVKKLSAEISNDKLVGELATTNSSVFIRQTAFWHESLAKCDLEKMDKRQLDRQEAIFELFKSEVDLIEDLQMICNTYRDSMRKLSLLNEDELVMIFGEIDSLVPIHQEIAEKLVEQRLSDGRTEFVGSILLSWIPKLIIYVIYCTNLIYSKDLLDFKIKENDAFKDFLNRCLNSPFSRKLDLWTFLDSPRSRLVKYPLMFKNIHKYTDRTHKDYGQLLESIDLVEEIIKDVDYNTGLTRCKYIINKLEYDDPKQMSELISESSFILCDGVLKNRRGVKLHVFLFDRVLILTRPITLKNNLVKYRVYRKPVANDKLFLIEPVQSLKFDAVKESQRESEVHKREKSHQIEHLDDHNAATENNSDSKLDLKCQQQQQQPQESLNSEHCSKVSSESFSSRASSSFRSVFSSISNQSRTSLSMHSNSSQSSQMQSNNSKDCIIELVSYSDQEDDAGENGLVYFGGRKTRHTLKADNELDKQHWLQCLKQCVRGCIAQDRRSSLESTIMNKDGDSDKHHHCIDINNNNEKNVLKAVAENKCKFAKSNKTRNSLGSLSTGVIVDENDKFLDLGSNTIPHAGKAGGERNCFDSTLSSYSSTVSVFSSDSGCEINHDNCQCSSYLGCGRTAEAAECNIIDTSNECLMCLARKLTNENRPKYLASTNLEDL